MGSNGHSESDTLRITPLSELHSELGARMVPFAGYQMPLQYADGIIAEHKHTRDAAGLFDVSHMGQILISGPDARTVATFLENLLPSDIAGLTPGRMRYTLLLNDDGGIVDDLIVTRPDANTEQSRLWLVVNAARKHIDHEYLAARLPADFKLELFDELALLALQGPQAEAVMVRHCPAAAKLKFMQSIQTDIGGIECRLSRCGYTGEDGFEISLPAEHAASLANKLLSNDVVKPIGLGARDTLRLEAGLPLYGQDLDETTTPVEAGLSWTIAKHRRESGGFPGSDIIRMQLTDGAERHLVGLIAEGRAPVRANAALFADEATTDQVGVVTSGGFGPTIGGPIAFGYVDTRHRTPGTRLFANVRGNALALGVSELPFTPRNYKRT